VITKTFQALFVACGFSLALIGAPIQAKLPAPSAEAKVKADEAKAKAAETAKVEAELLAKYQDTVASKYAVKLKAEGKEFKPTVIPAPAPAVAVPATPVAVVAPAASVAPAAVAPKK
jgi:hypothetical protein